MNAEFIFLFFAFNLILAWTLWNKERRQRTLSRSGREWVLDFIGLTLQGLVVPFFQTLVIFAAMSLAFKEAAGILRLPSWISFLVAFVLVDYLYYWNHRLLHSLTLWKFHSVHHSSQVMDVFATSRNSAVTIFLTLYIWVNGAFLFFLEDKQAYLYGVVLTSFLDIIRHSGVPLWPRFFPFTILTSPKAHGWHHSTEKFGINFGGNFNIWDRFHGTYYADEKAPASLGFVIEREDFWRAFWRGHNN